MFELIGIIFLWSLVGLFSLFVLFGLANALGKAIGKGVIDEFKARGFKGTLLMEEKEYQEEEEERE